MNKKIFGIKVSTYLTALLSLGAAFIFWLLVKSSQPASAIAFITSRFI